MTKPWRNDEYLEEIQNIYTNLTDDIRKILGQSLDILIFEELKQTYPDKFSICGLDIIFFYDSSITIKFPKIETYNDKIYITPNTSDKEIINKIFCKFLDDRFDYENFSKTIRLSINSFVENYKALIIKNFDKIRSNYFEDIDGESNFINESYFSKPSVLITYNLTENIVRHSYKPGEGWDFNHSISYKFKDILKYEDIQVKKYIETLNSSFPKITLSVEKEMNPGDSGIPKEEEYYDLELSRKINWFIHLNKAYHKYDYDKINHIEFFDNHFKYNYHFHDYHFFTRNKENPRFFINLLLIYVLVTQNIDSVLSCFGGGRGGHRNYVNLFLISEYFLNKFYKRKFPVKHRSFTFHNILPEGLFEENAGLGGIDYMISSFQNNIKPEYLNEIRFFYINYLNHHYNGEITEEDYKKIFIIFFNYFK